MKNKVLEIVQVALANSENELCELKKEIMNRDMKSEYFDSGITCQEFLEIYELECKERWKCLKWVKNAKRKKKKEIIIKDEENIQNEKLWHRHRCI